MTKIISITHDTAATDLAVALSELRVAEALHRRLIEEAHRRMYVAVDNWNAAVDAAGKVARREREQDETGGYLEFLAPNEIEEPDEQPSFLVVDFRNLGRQLEAFGDLEGALLDAREAAAEAAAWRQHEIDHGPGKL